MASKKTDANKNAIELPKMPEEEFNRRIAEIQQREKEREIARREDEGNYYSKLRGKQKPLSEDTLKALEVYKKKSARTLSDASAHNLLVQTQRKHPEELLAIYNWLDTNVKGWGGNDDRKRVYKRRRYLLGDPGSGLEPPDITAIEEREREIAAENKKRWPTYESYEKKDREKTEEIRKRDAEFIKNVIEENVRPDVPITDDLPHQVENLLDWHNSKRARFLGVARKYGYSAKDLEDKLDAAYNDAFDKHGDAKKAYAEIEGNLLRNVNKRFMAERGNQMTADLRAREEAIRNDRRAAARRAELRRQWGGNSQRMSYAQADAQARWKAQREAERGSRGNISAWKAYAGYEGSIRHGADVASIMNREWGVSRGRSLMPTGSASGNYMDAYNFNRRYNEAELRKANAAAERQEQQTKYMADVTAGVKTNQNPTKPQESAFGAVKFTDEPGNNAGV